MKNFRLFHLKTFIFLVVKISVYLNRLVLVMLWRDAAGKVIPQWRKEGAWLQITVLYNYLPFYADWTLLPQFFGMVHFQ